MPPRPVLIVTRPQAQARRFAADCAARLGWQPEVIHAPVMEIAGRDPGRDAEGAEGVILTSANAAELAPDYAGKQVYCVGNGTAASARARGGQVRVVAETAEELVARLTGDPPPAPLLHFRGEHTRGDIAHRLCLAGIETHEAVVYTQQALALAAAAIAAIEGRGPAVLPLFSPRSAALVGGAVSRAGTGLRVIAMSPAVAAAWREATGGGAETCTRPTAEEMVSRCVAALGGTSA